MIYIKSKNKERAATGFSLVELLVVISIIALLLSILMPVLGKAKTAAMRLKCASNLKQINLAMNMYLDGNNDIYPCAADPVDPNDPYLWLWMGRGFRPFIEPYLGDKVGRANDSVLFCPQDNNAKRSSLSGKDFGYTSYAYSMSFYHSQEQINSMSSPTDTYLNPRPSIPQKRFDVRRPSGKILNGEWDSNHQRVSHSGIDGDDGKWCKSGHGWWCNKGGRNFLLADGQVLYLKAEDIRRANDGLPDANLTKNGIKGIDWPR